MSAGTKLKVGIVFTAIAAATVITAFTPVHPVHAEPDFSEPSPSISESDCEKADTRSALFQCAYQSAKESDNRLNAVYQQVNSGLSTKERAGLIKTQLTWIKYRDGSCEPFLDPAKYRHEAAIQYWTCIDRLTQQRTAELENY
jgi:uncharacterized protein YecT (DUF1311 family)